MSGEFISVSGVSKPLELYWVVRPGVRPSVGEFVCLPQSTPVPGFVTVSFGNQNGSVFHSGARLIQSASYITRSGAYVRAYFQDRRWNWTNRNFTGKYNVRRPDGTIEPATMRNVRMIVSELFGYLGESPIGLTSLPADSYPTIVCDRDEITDIIEEILEGHGCNVTIADDFVVIFPENDVLPTFPTSEIISYSLSGSATDLPGVVRVVYSPTIVQGLLRLEPVGKDLDGSIVHVNSLSYTPSNGWTFLEGGEGTFAGVVPEQARRLAQKYVGKLWRVASQADGSMNIPLIGPVPVERWWPIKDTLLTRYPRGSGYFERPAKVFGRVWEQWSPLWGGNWYNGQFTEVQVPFKIHENSQLVEFSRAVVAYSGSQQAWVFPDLLLECAYEVQGPPNLFPHRWEYTHAIGPGTKEHVERRGERLVIVAEYDGNANLIGASDNSSHLNTMGAAIASSVARRYGWGSVGVEVRMRGILPYWPVGTIREVVFHAGMKGFYTQVFGGTAGTRISRGRDTSYWMRGRHRRVIERGLY